MINLKNFIKRYFSNFAYFYRRLKYRIFIRMILSIGVGFLDGFGLAMFLPLLQMSDGSSVNAKGLGNLAFLVNGMKAVGLTLNIVNVLLVMSLFFILKGVAQYVSSLYQVNLKLYFVRSMRIALSVSLSKMKYKAFSMFDAGRIQNTMSGEILKIGEAYQNYFIAFQQMVMVSVYMIFAFFVDAKFAILITVGGAATNLVFKKIYSVTKKTSTKLTLSSNFYQNLIIQFVHNFKYLKATGNIDTYNKKLIDTILFIEGNNRKIGKLSSIVTATREPLLIIVVSSVILLQINFFNGVLATMLISLLFFYRALSALIQMQTAYNNFLSSSGSLDNMTDFERELAEAKEEEGEIPFKEFKEQIVLDNASFKYGDKTILRNISLTIKKNQTVAFVGESGSGKTTLVNIISGLLPLESGSLTIDDNNIDQLNIKSWGRRIGYITQDPVIFNDTLFNNVSFWSPRSPETTEKFYASMKKASALSFLGDLSEKDETVLGNNGINLSGGQKQRISIARELYKEIDILILDEATSALDSETERAIQQNIEYLKGKLTILIVAHRLSTIKNADRIVIMNQGEIIDEGSFEDLVETSKKFKSMVALQSL